MRAPSDEELLAYLDGRLDAARRAALERQLELSWETRWRLEEVRRDIETYVRATREDRPPEFPDVDAAWEDLRKFLPAQQRSGGPWGARIWKLAPALTLAVVVGVAAWTRLSTPRPISASVILERARLAEQRRLEGLSQPVVHERFQTSRTGPGNGREKTVRWDAWSSARGGQSQELIQLGEGTVAPSPARELFQELAGVLERNGWDKLRPLAPAAFDGWLRRAGPAPPAVSRKRWEDGGEVYVLSAQVSPGPGAGWIQRCDYVVRAADWRPLEERFEVLAAEGVVRYRIARVHFEVFHQASLPAGFFPRARAEVTPPRSSRVVPALPPPSRPPSIPAPAVDRREARYLVRTHYLAHQQGLCTQAALDSGPDAAVMADWLRRWLAPDTRAEDLDPLSASTASLLAALQADAAALENLARSISEQELAALDPPTLALWNRMASEHLTAVERNAGRLRAVLAGEPRPAAVEVSPAEPEPPGTTGGRADLLLLADEVRAFGGFEAVSSDWPGYDRATVLAKASRLRGRAGKLARSAKEALARLAPAR